MKYRVMIAILISAMICFALPLSARADLSAILSIEGEEDVRGDEFTVSVYLEVEDFRGGKARLLYDAAQIGVVSVEDPGMEGFELTTSGEDGMLSFVLVSEELFTGRLLVMNVTFRVINGQEGELIMIDMSDRTASDGTSEVIPLYLPFTATLSSEIHTEETSVQTQTEAETDPPATKPPETTTPKVTTSEPETEPPETPPEETTAEAPDVTETVTADTEQQTETDPETTDRSNETDKPVTTPETTAPPQTDPVTSGAAWFGSGLSASSVALIIAGSLLVTGAVVFVVIYLIERYKNKKRDE